MKKELATITRMAFSALELLVVISLIGVLLGLLIPAVQSVRNAASRLSCQNNMRQIGMASHNYEAANGYFPRGTDGTMLWTVSLLPYLEQEHLFRQREELLQSHLTFLNPPHTGLVTIIKQYYCPIDSRLSEPIADEEGFVAAYCSYVGIYGGTLPFNPSDPFISRFDSTTIGVMEDNAWGRLNWWSLSACRLADITDGLSNTIQYGESPPFARWLRANWYTSGLPIKELWTNRICRSTVLITVHPTSVSGCEGPFRFAPGRIENPCDSHHLWSLHPQGANFVFADGSVRFMNYSADPLLPALATRAGGEFIELP